MNLQENFSRSKEVLGAYLRQGARELGNAFYGGQSAASNPELGVAFTKTPADITAGMRGEQVQNTGLDGGAPSVLDRYTQPLPEQETAPELDAPSQEIEALELDRD